MPDDADRSSRASADDALEGDLAVDPEAAEQMTPSCIARRVCTTIPGRAEMQRPLRARRSHRVRAGSAGYESNSRHGAPATVPRTARHGGRAAGARLAPARGLMRREGLYFYLQSQQLAE